MGRLPYGGRFTLTKILHCHSDNYKNLRFKTNLAKKGLAIDVKWGENDIIK
ncbi:hypothetical protein OkiPb00165_14080 [Escherichia coli]